MLADVNETRAINQQVLDLMKASKLSEAEALATKGLLLCHEAGAFRVFCVSQFNETLGDIAYRQAQYSSALAYHQQALYVRENGLNSGHFLISRSLLRVGMTHLALQQMPEAEAFVVRAVSGFGNIVPLNGELGGALGYLRKIYLDTDRVDDAVTVTRRELAVYEALGDKDGQAIANARLTLSVVLSRQATTLIGKNSYSDAEPILIEAIKLIDPPVSGREGTFSALQAQLGHVHERRRRYTEAEPFMLRALEYRLKNALPADAAIPVMLLNLASLYNDLRRPADTITYALRAVAWFDENKPENPILGHVLLRMGIAQAQLGQLSDAETTLLRSRDVLDRLLPKGDPARISVRNDIAALWTGQERYDEAGRELRSALEIEKMLGKPTNGWRATLLSALGMAYRDQGRYREAGELLSEAVKLEEAAGNERSKFVGPKLIELASVLRRENRYAEAEAALMRALALQPSMLDRASALNSLGVIYTATDRYERAETVLQEALAIRTKELPANSFFIAETIGNLAMIDSSKGHYSDAEFKLRHVMNVIDTLGLSRFSSAALYAALLSHTLQLQGKIDEAEALIRRSLDLYQQRLGSDHPRFAGALKTLASIEALHGRDKDAEEHYRRVLAIDEKAIGPQSPAVAADLMSLVPLLKRAGKRQEAKATIDRALAINMAQLGEDSPATAGVILASASMAYEEARYTDARHLAARARQIQERAFGPDHAAMARNWTFAARLDIAQGKLDDAGNNMDRAAQIIAKSLPPGHPSGIDVLDGKADVAWALGKIADAEQHNRDALAAAEKLYEPDHPVRRNALDRLSGGLWMQGRFADAERLQRDQLANIELKFGPNHYSTAAAMRGIANILGGSGRQGEAIALYRRALVIDERAFGSQSDQAARDRVVIGSLLRKVGQFEDARTEINLARNAWEGQGRMLAATASLRELALLTFEQGSPAESVVLMERALTIAEQTFGHESPALAAALAQLGHFYVAADRSDAAERVLARINSLIGENPPEQAPAYMTVLQLRAQLSAERGDFEDAEAGFKRAIAIASKYGGLQGNAVGNNAFNLATVYLKADRPQEAINYFVKALDVFKREGGDRAPIVGYVLIGAAGAYARIGDEASSKALLATATEILGPTFAAQRPLPRWL
ncbi:MAG: tetratricopeptide repeat protein [Pseudomonadota bacterium]